MPKKTNTIHCMPSCNWSLLACGTLACEASRRLLGEGWRLNLRDAGCSVVVFTSNGSQAMQAGCSVHESLAHKHSNVEHFHCSLHILQSCHHGKIHLLQKTSRDQSFLAIQPVKNNLPVVSLQLPVVSLHLQPASKWTNLWVPTLARYSKISWHHLTPTLIWLPTYANQLTSCDVNICPKSTVHHLASTSDQNQLSII